MKKWYTIKQLQRDYPLELYEYRIYDEDGDWYHLNVEGCDQTDRYHLGLSDNQGFPCYVEEDEDEACFHIWKKAD